MPIFVASDIAMKALYSLLLASLLFTSCKKEPEELLTLTVRGDNLQVTADGPITYNGQVFTRWQEEALVKGGEVIAVTAKRLPEDSNLVNGQWVLQYDMEVPLVIEATISGYGGGPFRSVGSLVHPQPGITFYLQVPELD